jgi:hypothetical protein
MENRKSSLRTWVGVAVIFSFGVVVGREWMKAELRSAMAEAFSGLSRAVAPEKRETPVESPRPAAAPPRAALKLKQKGIRRFAGNGCKVTYEVESSPGGFMVQAFAVGDGDEVLDSTNEMLKPVGSLVEFSFLRTPCERIKGLRWQVQ